MPRFGVFDITARASGVLRRIAKVRFDRNGTIYVFFPGFKRTDGILSLARLVAGPNAETQLDLTKNGRVTGHLVKYAHHPDGEAHFSQDGKVKTVIRRKSVPLKDQRGHLFTIQLQNIDSFPTQKTEKKEQLTLDLPEGMRALKITGWRFHVSEISVPDNLPPGAALRGMLFPDGVHRAGLLVAPPEGAAFDDVVLFLAVEEISHLSPDKSPQLIFMGGFDPLSVALNHSVDTEFLAFAYPCSDFGQLKDRIGSIDFVASKTKSG